MGIFKSVAKELFIGLPSEAVRQITGSGKKHSKHKKRHINEEREYYLKEAHRVAEEAKKNIRDEIRFQKSLWKK